MKPDCILIHPSLNFAGGAERQSIQVLSLLARWGLDCLLVSLDEPQESVLREKLGLGLPENLELCYLSKDPVIQKSAKDFLALLLRFLGFLKRLETEAPRILLQAEFDVLVPYADVLYFQAIPFSFSSKKEYANVAPRFLESLILRKLYSLGISSKLKQALRSKPVLVNSHFLAKVLNLKSYSVVHPLFSFQGSKIMGEKENLVLSVGRFVKNKGYHLLLPAAKSLAEQGYRIIIAGKLVSREYFSWLQSLKIRYGLENLELYPNPSFKEILQLYARAKIYVNPMMNESFGLTVLEAMSFFNVPVVHERSGAWTDILKESQGLYGFGFKNLNELKAVLHRLTKSDSELEALAKKARKRAEEFNFERFKTEVLQGFLRVLRLENP